MRGSAENCVKQARNEVRQVCEWLLRPSAQTMDACAPALERAVAHVREFSAGTQATALNNPQLIQSLRSLANEIHSTQALLTTAGGLYFGRMRRLANDDPDDTSSTPPPPS